MKNNHIFISLFCAHPKHIYTPTERRVVLICSLFFAAALSCFFSPLKEIFGSQMEVIIFSLVFGGLLQVFYDKFLAMAAKCYCVQEKGSVVKNGCECCGKCAICAQMFCALILLASGITVVKSLPNESKLSPQAIVWTLFVGKLKSWAVDSVVIATLMYAWARRGQLKPTDGKKLGKWNEVVAKTNKPKRPKKLWDRYIGMHLTAADLPDKAPSYRMTICFYEVLPTDTYGGVQPASQAQPVPQPPPNAPPSVPPPYSGLPTQVQQPLALPVAQQPVAQQPVAQPVPQAVPVPQPVPQPVVQPVASISVTCPANVKAGDLIRIQYENDFFDIPVPSGLQAGQAFLVQLPAKTAQQTVAFGVPAEQV